MCHMVPDVLPPSMALTMVSGTIIPISATRDVDMWFHGSLITVGESVLCIILYTRTEQEVCRQGWLGGRIGSIHNCSEAASGRNWPPCAFSQSTASCIWSASWSSCLLVPTSLPPFKSAEALMASLTLDKLKYYITSRLFVFLYPVCICAVSYTHLDVYKRQI